MDVYMKFFIYHVTNPEEVDAGKEKPHVEEKGPYAYREKRQKIYATNNTEGGDFIVFGQEKAYFFDKSQSCEKCSKDDKVTVVNAPLVGFAEIIGKNPAFSKVAKDINGAITTGHYRFFNTTSHKFEDVFDDAWLDSLFMESSVDDLIFSGTIPGALKFIFDYKMASVGTLLPPQIQEENGFAALNTKNASTLFEW